MEDLIPGLQEEIARECLLRVPHKAFRTARSVCKIWKQVAAKPRRSPKPWLLNRHREHLYRLENKLSGRPLLSSLDEGRPLNDLFNYKPGELPGVPDKGEERLYFTSPIWVNGMRKRSSEFGRWDARDGKLEIRDLEKREFGFIQHLIYFQGGCRGTRTKWAMKEYTLASSRIPYGVDELALCVIYKTRDYKSNETSCRKKLKPKTPSDDGGPSTSSEPIVQAEDPMGELTDLSFDDFFAPVKFPLDPIMDLENDIPWFGDVCCDFDNQEWA